MKWWGSYVGRRFDPHGFHCWGLVREVYRDRLGIDLPAYAEISARQLLAVTRAIMRDQEAWPRVTEPAAYDVVVMALPTSNFPGHVGLMVDSRHVLHVEAASHSVVVTVDHWMIRSRIKSFRRYAG